MEEARNLANENAIGEASLVIMNLVFRTSGSDNVKMGLTKECRIVGRATIEEQTYDGSARRVKIVLRCPLKLGVRINLRGSVLGNSLAAQLKTYHVRTRSKGASATPVATAAAPAIKNEAQGYGDAMSRRRSRSSLTPKSGTLKIALKKLLDQFSSKDCKTVYRKVAFAPLNTPHVPSFCQSWPITSKTELDLVRFK